VILRTVGVAQKARPIPTLSEDGMTLKTPAGIPARWASSAIASAERGVCVAGRATKLQPAASAGATLRAIIALGKFQGVIEATTPIGCFSTNRRLSGAWPGMVSP